MRKSLNEVNSDAVRSYIGLGSNLGDSLKTLEQANQSMAHFPETRLLATSQVYCSAMVGDPSLPDVMNQVTAIETRLTVHALFDALSELEQIHGRVREPNRGLQSRTLDLDLLLYGDLELVTADLIIPHPRMLSRHFVIYPLYEIAPSLRLPTGDLLMDYV